MDAGFASEDSVEAAARRAVRNALTTLPAWD
jgi:hypothetical protein